MTAPILTTTPINTQNRAVLANGVPIGWVLDQTLGAAPGWYFIARTSCVDRWPDSVTPAATWEAALPTGA